MQKIVVIAIAIGSLLGWAKTALAQTAGVSIDPAVVEILVSPNKKVIQAISVKNQGNSGQFVANIHKIMPNDKDGHVTIDPVPLDPTSVPIIITLEDARRKLGEPFTIGQSEIANLVIGIEGASTDEAEDIYFALVITPSQSSVGESSTEPGIASLLLVTLTPTGSLSVNLEISDFDPPLLQDSLSALRLEPVLNNKSPYMIRPEGTLEIISPRGSTHSKVKLYPNLLLGNSSRQIYGTTESTTQSGQSAITNLSWSPSLRNIGPYRVRLTITTLGGTTIQEIEKTVWVLPFKAVTLFVLLAFGTLLLINSRRRRVVLDSALENE